MCFVCVFCVFCVVYFLRSAKAMLTLLDYEFGVDLRRESGLINISSALLGSFACQFSCFVSFM